MEQYKLKQLSKEALDNVIFKNQHINLTDQLIMPIMDKYKDEFGEMGILVRFNYSGFGVNSIRFEPCYPECFNENIHNYSHYFKQWVIHNPNSDEVFDCIAESTSNGNPVFNASMYQKDDKGIVAYVFYTERKATSQYTNQIDELCDELQFNFSKYMNVIWVQIMNDVTKARRQAQSNEAIIKTILEKYPNALYDEYGVMIKENDMGYCFDDLNPETKQYVIDKYRTSWHLGNFSNLVKNKLDELNTKLINLGFVKPEIHIGHVDGVVRYKSINKTKASGWLFIKRTDPDVDYEFVKRTDEERNVSDLINGISNALTEYLQARYKLETTPTEIANHYRINHTRFDADGQIISQKL